MRRLAKVHAESIDNELINLNQGENIYENGGTGGMREVDTDRGIRNMIDQIEENITSFEHMLDELIESSGCDIENYRDKLNEISNKAKVHI